ncbi:MAG: sigma-70 family RNA polymerase sigma factor [Clostridiales bacterium]|jgi:RNA polymerase sigma-70 factor (ECF subfamily)|nr:sigma-70 family RNA polymerase sigma factor [Clostridiales bacterium]
MAGREIDVDALAVRQALCGDLGAFEALVLKYEKMVFSISYRMLLDRDEAQDAAQETFLKAFRALPSFKGGSKFATWLYRIAANACLDLLRKRKSYSELSLDAQAEDEDGARGGFDVADGAADIEAAIESREFKALVREAVDGLPDAHRAIIVMRDFQDMEYADIADALGCPEGTVKSRINRARGRLKRILLEKRELNGYVSVEYNKPGKR